jgi:uncharacterized protein
MERRALPIVLTLLISTIAQVRAQSPSPAPTSDPIETARRLLMATLGSTEMVWNNVFTDSGQRYVGPRFVFYMQRTPTSCGTVLSAMGPLYCASDRKIYLDSSFLQKMEERLAGCASAERCTTVSAYVIARLIGRHVQNLLGILPKVEQELRSRDRVAASLKTRMELQTDCLVGLTMKHLNDLKIAEGG